MSLSPPVARNKMHTRAILIEGYERADGQFDIEASIVDTKSFGFHHTRRGWIAPGQSVHEMVVRLTVDTDKVVRDIEVHTEAAPYLDCFTVQPAFKKLIGASLAKGWRHAVNQAVGGTDGCTHIKELLGPVATIAFQTMSGGQRALREAQALPPEQVPRPYFLDKCKGWDVSGEAVKELLPMFYVPRAASGGTAKD